MFFFSIPQLIKTLAVTAAAFLLTNTPVLAGRYELVKGKGEGVCEAYKKNLESFELDYPMACERKINPEFKEFEKPVWKPVDLEQHRELFRRLLRYQAPDRDQFHQQLYSDADLDRRIKEHKERDYPLVSHTNVNIASNSQEPNEILVDGTKMGGILIYRHNECGNLPFHESSLYVLTVVSGSRDAIIDVSNPLENALRTEISPNNGRDTSVGLFRYKGAPYIDKYCLAGNRYSGCSAKDTLSVYKYDSVRNTKATPQDSKYITSFHKICEYQYSDK